MTPTAPATSSRPRRFVACIGWEGWVLLDSALPGRCTPRVDYEDGQPVAFFDAARYGGWQQAQLAARAAEREQNRRHA